MAKDYYTILDIPSTATREEIRSAYRTRAKQFHPDHFGRDNSTFLNVREAYEVLSDPVSRRSYDRSIRGPGEIAITRTGGGPEKIRSRRPPVEPLRAPVGWRELGDVSLFGSFGTVRPSIDEIQEGLWASFDPHLQPKGERFRTLSMEVVLTPDQARRGGRLRILLPVGTVCPACGGAAATGWTTCRLCDGAGSTLGQWPLDLDLPQGLRDSCRIAVPLGHLGLRDVSLVVCVRTSGREGLEDF